VRSLVERAIELCNFVTILCKKNFVKNFVKKLCKIGPSQIRSHYGGSKSQRGVAFVRKLTVSVRSCSALKQGCQIFLGIKYLNGEKYTKLPRTVPNVHKI
jgi:hypothetical protein